MATTSARIEFLFQGEWTPLPGDRIPLPVQISVGRSGSSAQPDPPTMQFSFLGEYIPLRFGDAVRLVATLEPGDGGDEGSETDWFDTEKTWQDPTSFWGIAATRPESVRFVGEVSTASAVETDGIISEWMIYAQGTIANDGRKHVRTMRPQETEAERVLAVAALAGLDVTIVGTAALMLRADEIRRSALSAIQEIAASTGALFWQDHMGKIYYGLGDHRGQNAITKRIPDNAILDGVSWQAMVDGVVNELTISYGDPETPTEQTYKNQSSIDEWGVRSVSMETLLADEVEANTLAFVIFARRYEPFWLLDDILIPQAAGTNDSAIVTNSFSIGDAVVLGIPTIPGDVGEAPALWTVEGWVEEWAEDGSGQVLQVAVTDRVKWGARELRTWQQNSGQTWAFWLNYSWLQALIMED